METNKISNLAMQAVEAVIAMGISQHTAWEEHLKVYDPIMSLHRARGKEYFDPVLVNEFVANAADRLDQGEIGWAHYGRIKLGARRLLEFYEKGKMEWSCVGKVSKFKLNEYYEKIINDFLVVSEFHPNTQGDIVWVARKYFSWLIGEGKHDLQSVGAAEVQGFIIYCSRHMTAGSIHNTKLYLKRLYRYLTDSGLSQASYEDLLSFKVIRGRRIYPAASQDEVAMILKQADRRMPTGKRDYAIILLGAVTGLRAIDIARLKLGDIDWQRGEIKIVQAKTGKSLALPLTKDVGEAIEDYILYGRRQVVCDEIFLRDHRPYRGFKDGVAIGDMYDVYRKKAGLLRDPFDGNGFHSLRRGVGKNLVTSHTPVTTVAQILGQEDIDSAKQYIQLDSVHLKECALSFAGIEPMKGGTRI